MMTMTEESTNENQSDQTAAENATPEPQEDDLELSEEDFEEMDEAEVNDTEDLDDEDFGTFRYVDEDTDDSSETSTLAPVASDTTVAFTKEYATTALDALNAETMGDGFADSTTSDLGGVQGEEGQDFSRRNLHKKERLHKKLIIAACIVGGLVAIYLGFSIYFFWHFMPGTVVNGQNVSFMNVSQVEQQVEQQVSGYKLTIEERGSATETISGSSIDLVYVQDSKVQDLLDTQQHFEWIVGLFQSGDENKLHATVSFDETKLQKAVDNLDCMDTTKMKAPVDAYAEYNSQQASYVAHAEDEGTTIDTDAMYAATADAVTNTLDTLDIDSAGCYVEPAITSTSQELLDKIALYNQYCAFSITYTVGSKTEVLDANTAINWFTQNDDGTLTFDEDLLTEWMAEFGKRYDTVGTERTFTTATGATATVSGGTYGWAVDEDAEIEAVKEAMANHTSETREPIWASTAASHDATDWGSSYIELDLTNQCMYLYQNGAIIFQADVVTGLPTPSKQTPSGVWSILEMQSPSTLVGEIQSNGEPEYRTKVQYWMRMTWSGVGFHDATWQSSFGGDAYTYRGSHGCINMSYSSAQTLYSLIEVGLPVVSHY